MLMHSAEIRWFLPQVSWDEAKTWFLAGHELKVEDRTDQYLLLPDCDAAGVKLRGGEKPDGKKKLKFEIKSQVSPARPLQLDGLNGRTDQWVRWSLEPKNLKELEQLENEILGVGTWVKVRKERFLRKFSADADLVEVPSEQKPAAGCNIELTAIAVEGKNQGFSLAFEAFGTSAEVSKILGDSLRLFFQNSPKPPGLLLSGLNSMSYPAWLATLELASPGGQKGGGA